MQWTGKDGRSLVDYSFLESESTVLIPGQPGYLIKPESDFNLYLCNAPSDEMRSSTIMRRPLNRSTVQLRTCFT